MIGSLLCRAGLHKWRDCKRAVWYMPYSTLTLDLCACARCGEIRSEDAEQLACLLPLSGYAVRVEAIGDGR